MTKRDERQLEFADIFFSAKRTMDGYNTDERGILYLCPRFGKCRVAIHIFKRLGKEPSILIAYPNSTIKESWEEEFTKMNYNNPNITFTTHLSLKKHQDKKFDILVIDEIHLLSEAQMDVFNFMDISKTRILGLTGTMSSWTERTLAKRIAMNVIARYSIEQAIEEGVITDYEITVKMVSLDNEVKNTYKNAVRTEFQQCKAYGAVIKKMEDEKKDTFFPRLARMRLIQNSLAKLNATKEILNSRKNERILVFCGLIDIVEKIGCPVYHSGIKGKKVFEDFVGGKGKHMAVVKIGNTGTTYTPLDKTIVNYFDSNSENLTQKILRCMAMEYNNKEKKAKIWLISSNEDFELKWLRKALEFFDPAKIKYEIY